MPSVRKGERLVRKWADLMGFGHWRISVECLPESQRGEVWGRSEYNAEEEWATIQLIPDGKIPLEQLEGLVLHELAHGLLHLANKSEAHTEIVCNRIARLLGPENAALCNEWNSTNECDWAFKDVTPWVKLFVDGLPAEERQVVNALFYEGRTMRALAKDMNMSARTVGRIRDRALERIQSAVGQVEG